MGESLAKSLARFGMTAGDPGRRLTETRVGGGEIGGDEVNGNTALFHLVEGDQGGAAHGGVFARQSGAGGIGIGNVDEGKGQGVVERAVVSFGQLREDVRDDALNADAAEGLGRDAAVLSQGAVEEDVETVYRPCIAPETAGLSGDLADGFIRVAQGGADGFSGRTVVDPCHGPDRVDAGAGRRAGNNRRRQLIHRGAVGERLDSASTDERTRVVQKFDEPRVIDSRPVNFQAARVFNGRCADFRDAINGPQNVRLGELGSGATELVPAARVDDQEAAVGVFDHVRRMKVDVVAHEEIVVGGSEGRAIRREDVTRDFVEIEAGGEEIITVSGAKPIRLIPAQSTCGGGPEMNEDGHDIGGSMGMVLDDIVNLAVDAAVHGVNDSVALPVGGVLQERGGKDSFAAGGEDDVDGIVHASSHDGFEVGTVRSGAEDVGRRDRMGLWRRY